RVHVIKERSDALYATAGDGKEYLLWVRDGTMVAQQFDSTSLQTKGEPQPLAGSVFNTHISGRMIAGVSTNGILAYIPVPQSGRFMWLDRTGNPAGTLGEVGSYGGFRISPDGQRVVVKRYSSAGQELLLLGVEKGLPTRFARVSGSGSAAWSPDGATILFQS